MADNTLLNTGTGGDTIRDLARQSGTIKTQVVQLDLGGATANAEVLITAGQQTMAASVPVVLASNQSAVPVVQPYDVAGVRTAVTLYLDAVTGITTEALATMNINKGGTVTTGTSYTVTSGKNLRILFFGSSTKNTSTVCTNSRVRLRSAATVAATSPIFIANEAGTPTAVANCTAMDDTDLGDGLLIAGGQQVGISHIESATTSTVSCCLVGFEY